MQSRGSSTTKVNPQPHRSQRQKQQQRGHSAGSSSRTDNRSAAVVLAQDLSQAAQRAVDGWGQTFRDKVRQVCNAVCSRLGVKSSWPSQAVAIGTDCSGAEAPIYALRGMGVPHEHVFSCDVDPKVRKFIQSVCPPSGPIYQDMLKRDRSAVPAHDIYVCGFPCTPYSSLRRHSTKLMREAAAKPFFEVVRMITHHRPKMAVLENVMGIVTVLPKVISCLRKIPGYFIVVLPINCADLGQLVSRPRYYFVLVRQDCARTSDQGHVQTIVREIYQAMQSRSSGRQVVDMMLPNSCPAVQEFMASQRARAVRVGKSSKRGSPFDHFALSTWRQVDVWKKIKAQHENNPVITDVSQSSARARPHTAGIAPTLTPGSVVLVEAKGRPIIPIEKLLLHGFPVHRMAIPKETEATTLASLGGNTMHVMSVGLALLIGISLLDWSSGGQDVAGRTPASVALFPLGQPATMNAKRARPQSKVSTHPMKRRRLA